MNGVNLCRLLTVASLLAILLPASLGHAQSQCGQLPSLKVWGGLTNASVERYVQTKLGGDWRPYLSHLEKQLVILRDIRQAGKAAEVRYKGQRVRLTGKNLDRYVQAAEKRYAVASCLAEDSSSDLDVADLNAFSTAAGGSPDEDREVEVKIDRKRPLLQNATISAGALRLDVITSCENGDAVFRVTNRGGEWPKSSIFGIYRLGGGDQQVVSSRRMRLKANQSSTFRIGPNKNPTGELGLFVDPSWYNRDFDYDAVLRCR